MDRLYNSPPRGKGLFKEANWERFMEPATWWRTILSKASSESCRQEEFLVGFANEP
jgi:hypothetical protein